jgi:hypothetical protein
VRQSVALPDAAETESVEGAPEVSEQFPSVGRIVHYVSYGTPGGEYTSQCRAATITEIGEENFGEGRGLVGLCVLNPTGMFFRSLERGGCEHDGSDKPRGGTWHWPERI